MTSEDKARIDRIEEITCRELLGKDEESTLFARELLWLIDFVEAMDQQSRSE